MDSITEKSGLDQAAVSPARQVAEFHLDRARDVARGTLSDLPDV